MKKTYLLFLLVSVFFAGCDNHRVFSVQLDRDSLSLQVDETYPLEVLVSPLNAVNYNTVFWKSSDPTVATVSGNGVVSAVHSGACKITAIADGISANCMVTVGSVKINQVFSKAYAFVCGDVYGIGANDIVLHLLDKGLDYDSLGNMTGMGTFLNIELNTSFTENRILSGIYDVGSLPVINTCLTGSVVTQNGASYMSGTYYGLMTANGLSPFVITDGVFTVEQNKMFILSAEFTDNKNENISVSYSGSIYFIDKTTSSGSLSFGNFTSNVTNFYQRDTTIYNVMRLKLISCNYSDTLQLETYVPLSTSTDELPLGTYTLSSTKQGFFSLMPPSYEPVENIHKGCWLISNGTCIALSSGILQISKIDGAISYHFSFKADNGLVIEP